MSRRTETKKPGAGKRRVSDSTAGPGRPHRAFKATGARSGWQSPTLPRNWRERLPNAVAYYRRHIVGLGRPNAQGWAQGRCPLHEDRHESLSVNLASARGGWRCFAGCGHGDLVTFHLRLKGFGFAEAVRDLMEVRS